MSTHAMMSCDDCRVMFPVGATHTCWNPATIERRERAQRRVLDAAVAWAATETESRAEERALGELFDAVREMQEVD